MADAISYVDQQPRRTELVIDLTDRARNAWTIAGQPPKNELGDSGYVLLFPRRWQCMIDSGSLVNHPRPSVSRTART
jgi:hypothetical protein